MYGALTAPNIETPSTALVPSSTDMVVMDNDTQGNSLAPMSPMDSLKAIFEEMRDGINTLVELAYTGAKADAADMKDDAIAGADADGGDLTDTTDSQGNEGGFSFPKLEKPGPKLGLALLLGGLATLMAFGDKLVPIIAPVLKFIKEKALPFAIDAAKKAFEGIKTVFNYLYENIWPFIRDNVIMNAVDFVKDSFQGIVDLFGDLKDRFGVLFSEDATWWEKITAFLGIFTDIGQFFIDQFDRVTEFIANIFGVSFAPYDGLISYISGKLSEGFKVVVDWFSQTGEFLLEGATGIWNWITGMIDTAWTGISTWFSETGTFLLEGATGIVDWIKGKLEAPFAFLKDLFSFPDSPEGFATKLIDIVLLPYNLAINFIRGIFGFGEDEEGNLEPFSLGEFIIDTAKDAIAWFKGLFTFGDGEGGMFNLPNIGDAFMNMIGKLLPSPDSWIGGALYKIPGTGTLKKAAEMFAAGGTIEGGVMTMGSAEENLANGTGTERSALEQIKRNQRNMEIYDQGDEDDILRDGHTVESKLFELEMRNAELASLLSGAELKKLQEYQERQGYAEGGGIAVNTFNTDNSQQDNSNTNTTDTLAVEGSDSTAKVLVNSGYGDF